MAITDLYAILVVVIGILAYVQFAQDRVIKDLKHDIGEIGGALLSVAKDAGYQVEVGRDDYARLTKREVRHD